MKGHRLHVRRKMKENNGNFKKMEASLIKRLMRISSWLLISSFLELSHYSVSLTLIHLEFSWSILDFKRGREKQAKEGQGKGRKEKMKQGKEGSSSINKNTCR